MELRKIPDSWSKLYSRGTSTIIIGLYSHPSKCGMMHLVNSKTFAKSRWDKRQWRKATGLEVDLFFMGVKRLPKIIHF